METGSVATGIGAGEISIIPNQSDRQAQPLQRTLSYSDLIIYGMAYVTPFGVLQSLGFVWQESNGLMVLAYLLGTVCMYFTARSYASMTETLATAGSVYGFARHSLGPFVGFIAGWMILLDYLLVPAYVYVVMAVALGSLIPQVDRSIWIMLVAGTTLGVNWFGVRVSQRFNLFSIAIQLAILALLVLSPACLVGGRGNRLIEEGGRQLLHLGASFGPAIIINLSAVAAALVAPAPRPACQS